MLKGAIVGFGEVAARGHWPAYRRSPDLEIVAVVDPAPERRRAAAALSAGVRLFETVDCLAASSERIDFVDVCTPPFHHGPPTLAAISHGWHVLCEKPFLLDPILLEEVKTRARRSAVAVVPVDNW